MAAARDVGLDCDGTFSEAAAKVVKVRSKEVFEQAGGVLDIDDIERVHDMRVATRRLRAALEVFAPAFPRKRHRKALKKVKELADALGERRDADVEIELLESLIDPGRNALSVHSTDKALHREGREVLAEMIEGLRRRQRQANRDLAPFVAPKRLKKLHRRLKKLVKAAGS